MRSSGPINGEWIYPRLLVVDDNPLNQRLAERVLVKMGYCVDVVDDGAEAVSAMQSRDYLAALMDCQMPVMDGFDATRAIRAIPGIRGRTPIIAMTAYDTTENRQRCFDAGMNAFASKPVDWSSIESLLRNTASRAPTERTEPIDLSVQQARRDHVVLDLEVLAEVLGDRSDAVANGELLHIFRTESTDLFDRLGVALADGDAASSHAICTDLRGTVSSVGAERMASLMSDVGGMIVEGRIDEAIESADRIWDELALVLDALEARVDGAPDSTPASAPAAEAEPASAPGTPVTRAPWPAPTIDQRHHPR